MKIAIPFFRNRVSNRLDCSENFLIVTIENGIVKNYKKIRIVRNRASALINVLNQLEVDLLICGGITENYQKQLNHTPIQIIPWIVGEVDDVLHQYLKGKLVNRTVSLNHQRDDITI